MQNARSNQDERKSYQLDWPTKMLKIAIFLKKCQIKDNDIGGAGKQKLTKSQNIKGILLYSRLKMIKTCSYDFNSTIEIFFGLLNVNTVCLWDYLLG